VIFAAVPIKALAAAKTRLAPVLSAAERAALAAELLRSVLQALADSGVISATAVVSPDPAALALARGAGAVGLPEQTGDLNAALEQARGWALAGGAETLLVLLGDLPVLRGADIAALAEIAGDPIREGAVVVIAPDRHGQGTNALLLRPPDAIPFTFGAGSYRRHFQAAAARGAEIMVYRSPGTGFDLDTPEDLAVLQTRFIAAGGPPAVVLAGRRP